MRKFSWGSPNPHGRILAAQVARRPRPIAFANLAFALQALGFIFGLYVAYLCVLVLGTQP